MSVVAEIWKNPLLRIARERLHRGEVTAGTSDLPIDAPIASLVRQVFFSSQKLRRTRVLLLSTGPETELCAFAQSVGKVLSHIGAVTVALVESSKAAIAVGAPTPYVVPAFDSWRDHASQVTDGVWRLPADLLPQVPAADQVSASPGASSDNLPFKYVLFAAQISDSMLPLFCSYSEAAVLVLTANQSRRESAILAVRTLRQCNVELLGTVLDGRRFPYSGRDLPPSVKVLNGRTRNSS